MMWNILTDGIYTLRPRAVVFSSGVYRQFHRGFRERPEQNILIEWHTCSLKIKWDLFRGIS